MHRNGSLLMEFFQGCSSAENTVQDVGTASGLRVGPKGTARKRLRNKIRFSQKDLPRWAMKNDRWNSIVIPKFISFVGFMQDPWNIDVNVWQRALQLIVNQVYADLKVDLTVDAHSPMRAVVSSCSISFVRH